LIEPLRERTIQGNHNIGLGKPQGIREMKTQINSICVKSQRNRILERLRSGPLTTFQARNSLDVMHPSARIMELKAQGHNILTHWDRVDGHRIAKYVLFAGGSD